MISFGILDTLKPGRKHPRNSMTYIQSVHRWLILWNGVMKESWKKFAGMDGSLIIIWKVVRLGIQSFLCALISILVKLITPLILSCHSTTLNIQGLMRDMFTTKITTPEHWYMLMQPTRYKVSELDYDLVVGPDTVVEPSYDPHCIRDVKYGCRPVEIISAEKLIAHNTGRGESRKLAKLLQNSAGFEDWLIEEEAWGCIWEELIIKKKGLKTFVDREGIGERDYNFSTEMLTKMIEELTRLIDKYGPNGDYKYIATAQYLVQLLSEHRALIQVELSEVTSGVRKLTKRDFLGKTLRNDPSSPFYEKKM